ncbi:hypothetical protein, partial [Methylobacterium crusticola]|uniref:hypothetical protein n=1 Tax=Methylobacterium crusticola TaxID=1697972 RepID=UPI001EE393BA
RASVKAEAVNLETLGEQLKLFLKDNSNLPTPSNWASVLATYSDLNEDEILNNRRTVNRSYIRNTSVNLADRVLMLSS